MDHFSSAHRVGRICAWVSDYFPRPLSGAHHHSNSCTIIQSYDKTNSKADICPVSKAHFHAFFATESAANTATDGTTIWATYLITDRAAYYISQFTAYRTTC